MEKNKDNKKQVVYIVAGKQHDGIVYYWHRGNNFHWNIWDSINIYKTKRAAIRNAKKAKAIYKDSIGKTYVLEGVDGMPIEDFTPIKDEEVKTND